MHVNVLVFTLCVDICRLMLHETLQKHIIFVGDQYFFAYLLYTQSLLEMASATNVVQVRSGALLVYA